MVTMCKWRPKSLVLLGRVVIVRVKLRVKNENEGKGERKKEGEESLFVP